MNPSTKWWKNIGKERREGLLSKYNAKASAEFVESMYKIEFEFPTDLDLL